MSSPDCKLGNAESLEGRSNTITGTKRKAVLDTRRAEQNRAAQRAFRQRKELYVKELESKVQELQGLRDKVDTLEKENEDLRRRIWELEHRPSSSPWNSANPNLSPCQSPPTSAPRPTDPYPYRLSYPSARSPPRTNQQTTDDSATDAEPDKGHVLDDLIAILHSRQRPPIPAHLGDNLSTR